MQHTSYDTPCLRASVQQDSLRRAVVDKARPMESAAFTAGDLPVPHGSRKYILQTLADNISSSDRTCYTPVIGSILYISQNGRTDRHMDYKQLWHKVISRLQTSKGLYLDLTDVMLGSIRIGTGKNSYASSAFGRSYAYTCRIAAKSSQGDGQISLWMPSFCGETSCYETVAAVGENEPMHIGLDERASGIVESAGGR